MESLIDDLAWMGSFKHISLRLYKSEASTKEKRKRMDPEAL